MGAVTKEFSEEKSILRGIDPKKTNSPMIDTHYLMGVLLLRAQINPACRDVTLLDAPFFNQVTVVQLISYLHPVLLRY